ncbi:hypothetical protein BJY01DRAFT_226959 [Aspergillus pseudoustus]|uniref:Uncharacterized protein n=1 Tax=Aspergillus pseudoustus TaxID=1810923 RepID=A0ABR4ISK2_9EURO
MLNHVSWHPQSSEKCCPMRILEITGSPEPYKRSMCTLLNFSESNQRGRICFCRPVGLFILAIIFAPFGCILCCGLILVSQSFSLSG